MADSKEADVCTDSGDRTMEQDPGPGEEDEITNHMMSGFKQPDHVARMDAEPDVTIDSAVIEKLTTGTLGLFLPNLQKAKGSLNEVLHNQEVLIETLQQENAKFTESTAMKELKQTMEQAKAYHAKLVGLKREMTALLDKSTKLKRRAVKLQQQKQKEELTRAAQRERELERERMLTAKVARPVEKEQPS